MIDYKDIRHIEIEVSSHCNAACPLCPRNLFGYPYDLSYKEKNLTLEEIKKIFPQDFIKQLSRITFEGNFGDPLMNPELLKIIDYFNKPILIFTNGSLQTKEFWQSLAKKSVKVMFGIDGLNGVHEIYRRGTDFNKVIKNAKTFIQSGGHAGWKMIRFDHNQHQIEECKKLSVELGFKHFQITNHGRAVGPVFNRDGKLERTLGNFTGSKELKFYKNLVDNGDILIEDIADKPKQNIKCNTIKNSSIYITSTGEVYPCCYMGFSPRTYGKGRWHQPANEQIKQMLKENNALDKPLQECIEWFNHIPERWNMKNYKDGRLIVCDSYCGK